MRYVRPLIEVEAMFMKGEEIFIVEWPDGRQSKMGAEEFARDFRKRNGQDPVKKQRRRVNYRTSAEAPDLSTAERAAVVADGQGVGEQ